jgi:hypothetical protein
MSVLLSRVEWVGKSSDGEEDSQVLSDVESISITKEMDATANKATIILNNPLEKFASGYSNPLSRHVQDSNDIRFKEGDVIKIYAKQLLDSYSAIDTSDTSPDLLMTGEVEEVTVRLEAASAKVTLSVVDKTYVILNKVFTKPIRASDNLTTPEAVQLVIQGVTDEVESDGVSFDNNGDPVNNGIYGVDARLASDGGFIEDERIDGSSFPVVSISKVYKPAYEWIQELSSLEYTNDFLGADNADSPTQDRQMIFYMDEKNKFHWFYPRDAVNNTLSSAINSSTTTIPLTDASTFPTAGTVFIGAERIDYTGKSTNDLTGATRGANNSTATSHSSGALVTTAIQIVEGSVASSHVFRGGSMTKKTFDIINYVIFNCGKDLRGNGITHYHFERSTKSKTLKGTYKPYTEVARELFKAELDEGNLIEDNTQTTFNWQGNFYKADTYGFTTTWGIDTTGFSDSDYNSAFRARCKVLGKGKAETLTKRRGSPRWKGTLNMEFKRYTAGEQVEFTSTRAGINYQPLRIKKVRYVINKSGGQVSLDVEEDEAKLGEVL